MNAYILPIADYIDIFISYNTPIGARIGDRFLTSKKWYSSTTTRQTNRYVRENNLDVVVLNDLEFLHMIKTYAAANDFSLGLLR